MDLLSEPGIRGTMTNGHDEIVIAVHDRHDQVSLRT